MSPMQAPRALFHIAWADLLERIRRYSFLIVLVSAVMAGYLAVPQAGTGYRVLQVGSQRGIYDSAWIGLMFGLIAALHLPLAGFYLVNNAVQRDRQTGVGEILAATPLSKPVYVLGKWLSNLAVLALILAIMTAMAVVMQLVRAEDTSVRLGALVPTIWLMAFPVLALAAALAVLLECTPFLRGNRGNVLFLFIWLFSLVAVLAGSIDETTGLVQPRPDLHSFSRPVASIQQQVLDTDPEASVSSGLIITGADIEGTFRWPGVVWKAGNVLERLRWLALALLLTLAAALPFDRFDPARHRQKPAPASRPSRREPVPATGAGVRSPATGLTPLSSSDRGRRFFGVLVAELKLMLKGQNRLWVVGAVGLNLACLFNPVAAVQRYLLAAVWLWPLAIWSQMGARERRFNTGQMVLSAPHPIRRQLPATWLAGIVVAIVLGSGGWLRLALTGETASLLGWFTGALFVPALALALGVWTGSSRAFEAGYLFLWYLGAVEGVPALDYTGTSVAGGVLTTPLVSLALAAGLFAMAMIGRWRRLPV